MKLSVIISTYNNPEWLEKVLWGYLYQEVKDFEILIADDGSESTTFELLDKFKSDGHLSIKHVWHEDDGFQKSAILNKAIVASTGDYIVFTDGDCIPKRDFLSVHKSLAKEGRFLSGGYCKLPMDLSKMLDKDVIDSGDAFDPNWLKINGLSSSSSLFKIAHGSTRAKLIDKVTPTKATWNGCNASTFKKHILDVNGHNEEMKYGGQDREMGQRMINNGIKPMQIRNRAILLHLDHSRGYRTQESIDKNLVIREITAKKKLTWTESGIQKGSQ